MKKTILACFLFMQGVFSYSQLDNYSATGAWGLNIASTYTPLAGCGVTAATAFQPLGSYTIASNRLNINDVRGACINRIAKPLGTIYDTQFNMDFDFNLASSGTGIGSFLILLSSQNLNPSYAFPMTTCVANNIMDMIGVSVGSPAADLPNNPVVSITVMDNGVNTITNGINIAYGTTYFASVRVFNNGFGEFLLFTDSGRTQLFGSFCFDVPSTVTGLAFMQHSTSSAASRWRVTRGWLDNSNVYRTNNECCAINITGPQFICGLDSATFGVTTTGISPEFHVPPGITFIENANGTITVTDWGTVPSAPTIIPITATSICQCDTIRTSYNVFVYPPATFEIVGLGTSGTQLTNFSAVSGSTPTGTTHTWELYLSNSSKALVSLIRGPVTLTSSGSGATFNINATSPLPVLLKNTYYIIRHTVTYPDGVCQVQEMSWFGYFDGLRAKKLLQSEINNAESKFGEGRTGNNNLGIFIFPNPTSSQTTVESDEIVARWDLLDADGKLLKSETCGRTTFQIDLGGYSKGMYMVKLYTASKVVSEKIIVQ
jgi:hypothetical protein